MEDTIRELEQSQTLAYVDDLTGLYNRRYFRERLLAEKRKADRESSSFGLAMIDLDNFKPVNDLYGHLTGDKVLSQVGQLLRNSIRPRDVLCRYAGDEFVVIFPEIKEDGLVRVAERIKENFAEASWKDEKGESIPPITCSMGYCFYGETGKDLNRLIGWADEALYCAKRRGGNGYCGEREVPTQAAGRPLMHTPYVVGRDKELTRLKSLLDEVSEGAGRLVLIHGEAGVGKTRLVRELRQVLERRGGACLLGNCHEETHSIPYYPFRDAFDRLLDEKKDLGLSMLKNLPEYSQRELARILPRLRDMKPSELERAPDSFRLFEAVRLLLEHLSAQSDHPLLLVAEDLQWSDKASLDLLHYLARNLMRRGVLLCGTYRTEEKVKQPTLIEFAGLLRRERLSEEMPLGPLGREGVSAMVRLLYPGRRVHQGFQDFMYHKTEGNPFFVEELVKILGEEHVDKGSPTIPEVPLSIYAVLQRRMDSLVPKTKEILACAALVGEEFEFEVLRRVQDRSQQEILSAVDAAVKARLLRESFEGGEERYHFMHSLMTDVLYAGIGKVRRRLLHGQVGEALEDFYAGRLEQLNGRLAYHFERGEKWEKALRYALQSARQARDDYANEEAIRFYRKAREMLPRLSREADGDAAAIAQELGSVYEITGEYGKALQEYQFAEDLARRKGDGRGEADASSQMSRVYRLLGDYDEMMSRAERSYVIRQAIGDQGGLAEDLHTIGTVHFDRGDYGEALKYLAQSLKMRREIGDKRGVAASLAAIGAVHWKRGNYEAASKCDRESLSIRRVLGDKRDVAASLNAIGNIHWGRGEYRDALKCHIEAMKIRREIGDKRGTAGSLTNIGNVHWGRGEYGEALKCHQGSLVINREIGSKTGVAASLTNIGNIYYARGEYGDALDCHEESLAISRGVGDKMNVALSLLNIGDVRVERGDYQEALKCYEDALGIQTKIGEKSGLAISLLHIGKVHQDIRNIEEAMAYHRQALSVIERVEMKTEKTEALTMIGMDFHLSGEDGKALEHLKAASGIVAEFGTREAEPALLEALGEVSLSRGDLRKANEYCEQLLRMAEDEDLKKYLAVSRKLKAEILLSKMTSRTRAKVLKEAEVQLEQALAFARRTGALPLLWRIQVSLGRLYSTWSREGDQRKALEQFSKAKEVIEEIASRIGDEELRSTFLASGEVQSVSA